MRPHNRPPGTGWGDLWQDGSLRNSASVYRVNVDPTLANGLNDLIELISRGDLSRARGLADQLLQQYPQHAELWRLSGICALQMGDLDATGLAFEQALKLAPNSVEALCNLASLRTASGNLDEAEDALHRALQIDPQHAGALNNLGSLLDARGDYHAAADCFARAIKRQPGYARAWLNQAAALFAAGQLDRAEISTRRTIALAPQWPDAHFMLGNVLSTRGESAAAVAAYRQAIHLAPGNARFHYQLGLTLDTLGEITAAADEFVTCLRTTNDFWPALSQLTFTRRRLCDWHALPPLSRRLLDAIDAGAGGITPFSMLVEETTPAQQLRCASRFAETCAARVDAQRARLTTTSFERRPGPIRVGFVAAGFGEHPTASLIVDLVERLRDSQLHTIGYATTPDDQGTLRRRLQAGFHEFADLSGASLEAAVRRIRNDRPDILLDLDGYCEGARAEIFALRAAPLQVNYLAYPGTLGAPWYDYLIADRFLIPDDQRACYSEKIARLPRCYQPSDATRTIAQAASRRDYGLPDDAVVFACFNNSWKYTLRSFARWMRILQACPDSVLWLLTGPANSGADERMCRAAQAAGVNPKRLIFAPRAAPVEHLARYRLVDLFLDTNPYNAHTTASDALWAGCPVMTLPGATFASRVAGSMNHQLGLHDFNAESDQAYIDAAAQLGAEPTRLRAMRERVEQAKTQRGLFDMHAYARDFERMLSYMFELHQQNRAPEDFEISE